MTEPRKEMVKVHLGIEIAAAYKYGPEDGFPEPAEFVSKSDHDATVRELEGQKQIIEQMADSAIQALQAKLKAKHAWLNPPSHVSKDALLEYYHDHADVFKDEWDKAESKLTAALAEVVSLKARLFDQDELQKQLDEALCNWRFERIKIQAREALSLCDASDSPVTYAESAKNKPVHCQNDHILESSAHAELEDHRQNGLAVYGRKIEVLNNRIRDLEDYNIALKEKLWLAEGRIKGMTEGLAMINEEAK